MKTAMLDWNHSEPLYVKRSEGYLIAGRTCLERPTDDGHWLVSQFNGITTCKRIEPEESKEEAMLEDMRRAMTDAMASLYKNKTIYHETDHGWVIEEPSLMEIIESGLTAIRTKHDEDSIPFAESKPLPVHIQGSGCGTDQEE